MEIQGTVGKIYSKEINTRYGPKPVYNTEIDGQRVDLGFKKEVEEGEYVTLEVEQTPYGLKLKRKNSSSGGARKAPAGGKPSAAAPRAFPIQPDSNQTSIVRQSAMNRAVEVMDQIAKTGLVTFDSVDDYMTQLFTIAYEITDFGTGQREVKHQEAMAALGEDE